MHKSELISAVIEKTDQTRKAVEAMVNAYGHVTTEASARGEVISLVGIGSFEVAHRAARQGRNPKTGETLTIAASKQVKSKPGKPLKFAVSHVKG